MRFLITAGPTREFIDDVRFLSNPSTGRMGLALAREALRRGHEVRLVVGPVELPLPRCAEAVRVTSAVEMLEECRERLDWCDCLVMTAAVSDYRPSRKVSGKVKKDREEMTLRLKRNPDILGTLAPHKGRRIFVGFALEAERVEERARRKLVQKPLDLIVANSLEAFSSRTTSVLIIARGGKAIPMTGVTKDVVAAKVLDLIEEAASRGRQKH